MGSERSTRKLQIGNSGGVENFRHRVYNPGSCPKSDFSLLSPEPPPSGMSDSEDVEILELEKKQLEIALQIAEQKKARAAAEEAERKAREEAEEKAKEEERAKAEAERKAKEKAEREKREKGEAEVGE